MTETIQTTIERDILIQAPIDIVWRTVTEPELIPLNAIKRIAEATHKEEK